MMASLKKLLGEKSKDLSGNKDVLEGVCAISALVASADGSISDKEIDATLKAVGSNENLAKAYNQTEIRAAAQKQLSKAAGGRVGQFGLKSELKDVAERFPQFSEIVFLSGLDVAEAGDGVIDDKEKAMLIDCAGILGLDAKAYGISI